MSNKLDLIVFIGRFQPVHIEHIRVIETALTKAHHVLVLVGSSFQPRTPKNPWLFSERKSMISDSVKATANQLLIRPLRDSPYNDQVWATNVQYQVTDAVNELQLIDSTSIRLIGHTKDESSYYLKMFPQWGDSIEHPLNEVISATDIRQLMFEGHSSMYLNGVTSKTVGQAIEVFRNTAEFTVLQREYNMIKQYHKSWAAAPYPPTFVTVDAVVVQSGCILLIERAAAPGEGLFALPGGFLDRNERIVDGVIRELREETKLKVPTPVLKGSIVKSKVYDDPNRSARGRTITHAYLIELPSGPLPKVKGSDDAAHAFWIQISELDETKMFEDHFHLIQDLLGNA